MTQPAFEVSDVHVRFGPVTALAGARLAGDAGRVLGLLGPNGSGKTTTVGVLTTLVRPDSGTARVCGHDVVREAAEVRRNIAVTGQFAALDSRLTAVENLRLFGRMAGLGAAESRARADELLGTLDLEDARDRRVGAFSGGMLRRVDIAVALVGRPRLLILDEPTTGLDPRSRRTVWDLVSSLRDDGVAILLTSQYLDEVDRLADHVVVLDHGAVVTQGTPAELKDLAGAPVCEIVFVDPGDAARFRTLAAGLHPHPPDSGGPEVVTCEAADGQEIVARVLGLLDSAGLTAAAINLRRPTLDEVFLHLTAPAATRETAAVEA